MHYSHNPWVKHKKDKRDNRAPAKTISKRSCAMQRNVARFNNVPDVSSFSQSTRKRVLEQHNQWCDLLSGQPRETLHRSCYVSKDGAIPRQTAAWLVEEYCKRQKVEYQTVFDCITASNGDLEDPKLITNDEPGNVHINLLALDNPTLWRVYQQVPVHQRQAHPPAERPPQAPRPMGRPRKQPPQRTMLEPPPEPPQPLEPPPIVEVEVFWACCDKCSKWRRVPTEPEGDYWECSAILLSCDQPEDGMDDDEKWTGEVKGEQSSALPSTAPSAAASEPPESQEPESQEPVPAPAAEPVDPEDPEDDDVASIDLFGEEDSEAEWETGEADEGV
jgi:hypothetical protein